MCYGCRRRRPGGAIAGPAHRSVGRAQNANREREDGMGEDSVGKASGVGRRGLLLGAGALATAGRLGMPYIGNAAAAEPIKIGMIWAKTGQIVDQAQYLAQGGMLALEQRNNMLLGRPAEIVWLDEPNPQGAQQNAERLVGEQKVVGIVGGALSSFALAISAVAKKAKVPFIAANAAAGEITGKSCNRYTFRVQPPVDVHTRVLAPYCADIGKKWYLLTASYAFGQDIKRSFTEYLQKAGGTLVGADEVPLNTPDYSSFILKIRAAKPDVVIGGISASDLTTFLKQWNELGMKGRIPFAEISVGNTDLWGVGPEAADGLFTLTWYYKNPSNPPEEQAMAAAYEKKYGRPAADKTWMGWLGMKTLLDSIEAAGSTDPAKVVSALEAWKWRRNDLDVAYRDFDHQMVNRLLIASIKPKITDKWDYFDVKAELPKTPDDVARALGEKAESLCKMDAA
jgi:branched-chain amino acid transport system substrate-binding protein